MTEPTAEALAHQIKHRNLPGPCQECVPAGMMVCPSCGRAHPYEQWCICPAAIEAQHARVQELTIRVLEGPMPEPVDLVSIRDPVTYGTFTLRNGIPDKIYDDEGNEIVPCEGTALRVWNGTWEYLGPNEWEFHRDKENKL